MWLHTCTVQKVMMTTPDGYLLTRDCLSNCRPSRSVTGEDDKVSYTECCYTDLCNAAASLRKPFQQQQLHLILSLLATVLVARRFLQY